MRRIALGFLAGAAFVLSSGLMTPAHASIYDFGIDSPADGATTHSQIVNVEVHAKSDGNGIARLRLDLSGPHFASQKVWCEPTDSSGNCASWQSGQQPEYSHAFGWDTHSLTTYNGEYTLTLTVVEVNQSSSSSTQSHTVEVATPPQNPQWNSIAASTTGGPHVTLRWAANPEPDITAYRINRPAQNGQSGESYTVDPSNPGAQNCSSSGSEFSCTDSAFSGSGYSGDYTYYLTAVRSSPSDPGGASSGQSSRAATLTAPSTSNAGGNDGGTPGSSSGGGNGTQVLGTQLNNVGGPAQSLTPDPTAVNPNDFFSGTYQPTLPYGSHVGVGRTTLANPQAAGSFGADDARPLNARKLLLPIAGGLFTLIAALHFRRVLRDA